jgi:hypothetical protein
MAKSERLPGDPDTGAVERAVLDDEGLPGSAVVREIVPEIGDREVVRLLYKVTPAPATTSLVHRNSRNAPTSLRSCHAGADCAGCTRAGIPAFLHVFRLHGMVNANPCKTEVVFSLSFCSNSCAFRLYLVATTTARVVCKDLTNTLPGPKQRWAVNDPLTQPKPRWGCADPIWPGRPRGVSTSVPDVSLRSVPHGRPEVRLDQVG